MARSRNLISLGGPEGQKGTNSTLTSGTQNGRTIRLMREPRSWRNQPQRTGIHPRGRAVSKAINIYIFMAINIIYLNIRYQQQRKIKIGNFNITLEINKY